MDPVRLPKPYVEAAAATRSSFLQAYRRELASRYAWATDSDKLARFMRSVDETLDGSNSWNHDGAAVTAAWKLIGGKGQPSLKALRGLPVTGD